MARIEAADSGDTGLVREWLARGIQAMPDPQWVADGVVADEWAPLSPISHKLDGFEWKVPPEDDVISEDTHTLKKLLAGLVTAEGLTAASSLESSSVEDGVQDDHSSEMVLVSHSSETTETDDVNEAEVVDVAPVVEVAEEDEQTEVVDKGQESQDQQSDEFDSNVDLEREEAETETVAEVEETVAAPAAKQAVDPAKEDAPSKTKSKRKRRKRTKIYVAPPAPDDPGTDDTEDLEIGNRVRPVRF
jgi:HemY protein